MLELHWEESWAPKNWCFWTVVLEKTLQSPLDCKIQPVHPKGDQSWVFIGETDAEAGTPMWYPRFFHFFILCVFKAFMGFTGGRALKNLPSRAGDARDMGLITGLGRSLGVSNGNPLQYFCLTSTMDRGSRQVTVHGVEIYLCTPFIKAV